MWGCDRPLGMNGGRHLGYCRFRTVLLSDTEHPDLPLRRQVLTALILMALNEGKNKALRWPLSLGSVDHAHSECTRLRYQVPSS